MKVFISTDLNEKIPHQNISFEYDTKYDVDASILYNELERFMKKMIIHLEKSNTKLENNMNESFNKFLERVI